MPDACEGAQTGGGDAGERARVVIPDEPSEEAHQFVRDWLPAKGWMPDNDQPLPMPDVIHQAEQLVFRNGGWLTVASKLQMKRESLARIFRATGNVTAAREMLTRLKAEFPE